MANTSSVTVRERESAWQLRAIKKWSYKPIATRYCL